MPSVDDTMFKKLKLHHGEMLVLASASPRRADLLTQKGIPFQQISMDIDEDGIRADAPAVLVRLLAEAKSEAWKQDAGEPERLVLTADTVVAMENRIFGKPADIAMAREFFRIFSGRTHQVYTGVCLRRGNVKFSWTSASMVTFRKLDEGTIDHYFSLVNPLDKAGGYGIQIHSNEIISSFSGLLSTVIGLPVEEVAEIITGD